MFLGLMFLWISDGKKKREQVLHALFAALVAWGFASMIKVLFPTDRPFEIYNEIPLTVTTPSDSAFPSAHATTAFALAMSIWIHDKKWGTLYIVFAVLVSLGRVLSNVHFVGDILGGAFLGIVVSYLVSRLHLFKLT
jgi:undecaprenyl-diphosphatase